MPRESKGTRIKNLLEGPLSVYLWDRDRAFLGSLLSQYTRRGKLSRRQTDSIASVADKLRARKVAAEVSAAEREALIASGKAKPVVKDGKTYIDINPGKFAFEPPRALMNFWIEYYAVGEPVTTYYGTTYPVDRERRGYIVELGQAFDADTLTDILTDTLVDETIEEAEDACGLGAGYLAKKRDLAARGKKAAVKKTASVKLFCRPSGRWSVIRLVNLRSGSQMAELERVDGARISLFDSGLREGHVIRFRSGRLGKIGAPYFNERRMEMSVNGTVISRPVFIILNADEVAGDDTDDEGWESVNT